MNTIQYLELTMVRAVEEKELCECTREGITGELALKEQESAHHFPWFLWVEKITIETHPDLLLTPSDSDATYRCFPHIFSPKHPTFYF